ncbi:hypothetical protein PVAP13_4KG233800 [Panicum virgatum]|uniref:Uncharacterized protein n=2 Tax=Panicum virgatum TaxID=38727 RepID=A0A8T0TSD0_PANVG|nr:hypothetical protein PVAP13_4KG233800 [Panicum virgatum]KAG2611711.1 hypothetical protein PVAP13_4KG233800 [Panicum virgatum]KAG2611714.1 hypothetical protein PVAP13_4KG233800 [Panicum virgatum]
MLSLQSWTSELSESFVVKGMQTLPLNPRILQLPSSVTQGLADRVISRHSISICSTPCIVTRYRYLPAGCAIMRSRSQVIC